MSETKIVTKKGKPAWKPANVLELSGKDNNYKYYWARETAENIAKKQQEGWELVDTKVDKIKGILPDGIDTGNTLGDRLRSRGMILMRMPNELSQARREYFSERVKETTQAIAQEASQGIKANAAKPYGRLEIS